MWYWRGNELLRSGVSFLQSFASKVGTLLASALSKCMPNLSQTTTSDLPQIYLRCSLVTATFGELTREKTVVVFAVPGAFTPTCSTKHLPGYVSRADELRARGVDAIMCVSVNDAFVMNAWGESAGARTAGVRLLADGSAELSRAMGTDLDLSAQGMGIRSRRFAMIVRDGVVEYLAMEAGDKYETSGAEDILKRLPLA